MRKIESIIEQKNIQLCILDAVNSFCAENKLKYSMAFGTLLGAVRHQGYIPWDDDIDICMPRIDYDKFINKFPLCYKERYSLASLYNYERWPLAFSKVYDIRTICKEKRSRVINPGINIDVFPVDSVPEYDEMRKFTKDRRRLILDIQHSNLKYSGINSIMKNIASIFFSLRYLFVDRVELAKELDTLSQSYNNRDLRLVYENTSPILKICPYSKDLFEDIIELSFEDRKYKAFREFDEYLRIHYGDYMTPPPVEERVSFHTFDAYWKD